MPKSEKWGKIGAPGSKKRKDFLASIRKKKRKSKAERMKEKEIEENENIEVIEAPTKVDVDIDYNAGEAPAPATPVAELKVAEKKKKVISDPGVADYVDYPY